MIPLTELACEITSSKCSRFFYCMRVNRVNTGDLTPPPTPSVVDLARGHVAALEKLYTDEVGCEAVNLGTGNGVSVLQLVDGMARASGKTVPYTMAPRRPGDVASMYADATMAENLLKWKAKLGVDDMCEDTWRWQSTNPYGYKVVEEVQE
jgi:nucleoside-diphosphate-sugar epimerase